MTVVFDPAKYIQKRMAAGVTLVLAAAESDELGRQAKAIEKAMCPWCAARTLDVVIFKHDDEPEHEMARVTCRTCKRSSDWDASPPADAPPAATQKG